MILANYILQKPWYFRFIPRLNKYTANSLYPFIFVPQDVYKDLQSSDPDPRHIALLMHEETHRKRQKQMGLFTFGIKYLFDSKFRFNEELLAVKAAMKYLKKTMCLLISKENHKCSPDGFTFGLYQNTMQRKN